MTFHRTCRIKAHVSMWTDTHRHVQCHGPFSWKDSPMLRIPARPVIESQRAYRHVRNRHRIAEVAAACLSAHRSGSSKADPDKQEAPEIVVSEGFYQPESRCVETSGRYDKCAS